MTVSMLMPTVYRHAAKSVSQGSHPAWIDTRMWRQNDSRVSPPAPRRWAVVASQPAVSEPWLAQDDGRLEDVGEVGKISEMPLHGEQKVKSGSVKKFGAGPPS